jgi:hypothetical protein
MAFTGTTLSLLFNIFTYLFIYSFIRLFIYSFIYLFIRLFKGASSRSHILELSVRVVVNNWKRNGRVLLTQVASHLAFLYSL